MNCGYFFNIVLQIYVDCLEETEKKAISQMLFTIPV